jgi:vacuolar iron transporter family protein
MITTTKQYLTGKITKYLPEFVYGSIDGTVTTFAIIAGIAGANLDTAIVAILGFSNVLADGFSMASSNYLSEQSHQEQNPDQDHHSPIKTALATFISFISIGSIPVVAYLIIEGFTDTQAFFWTTVVTGITFIGIGAVRGILSQKNSFRTAMETLAVGMIAAGVAYGVGAFLGNII